MVENSIGPSELHLKKELTALGKSRFLRDPDTHMSWKSPLNSASVGSSNLNFGNEHSENKKDMDKSTGSFELLPGHEYRRKKVYLYNWGHHSSKSSDSGIQLDKDKMETSIQDSPEEDTSNTLELDFKGDAYLEEAEKSRGFEGKNSEISVRKAVRKSSRGIVLRKKNKKNSAVTEMLDLASNSLETLQSAGKSDDSGYCSSEELQKSKSKLTQKIGYCSQCASPVLSRSGCGNLSNSAKILRSARRERSSFSCTPASNSSSYIYRGPKLSAGKSWEISGDEVDQLDGNVEICGFPFNLSMQTREPFSRSCSSASFSDTPRRMLRSIICGSHTGRSRRRSSSSHKHNYTPKSSQGVPLLTNSFDGIGSSEDSATNELATSYGELDLEAMSRLDERRWSNCRSQGPELGPPEGFDSRMIEETCLSQKYRPRSFDEIVGQNIVVESLNSAIVKGRVAPAYIFQGPRGTGKTSVARVFAAALNCLSTEEIRPCGLCTDCNNFASGIAVNIIEVDARNKREIGKIRYLLRTMPACTAFSSYKVFVIDECHLLSSKSWSAFMKVLEGPHSRVVFIFITNDSESLPRAVVSRCLKYLFSKVKDADIALRLRKLSAEENLDVEWDALELISSNSDGSLRNAETMLDQLSLLGKKITISVVKDLVGVVSDEKLLGLLEVALSSDTAETVKMSRELMESGIDPVALMTQLASLIMDIIAGTHRLPRSQSSSTVLYGQSSMETETERLQQALKVLSDAEKQLRLSSERSTWFTAALLQIGTGHSPQPTPSRSSTQQSTERLDKGVLTKIRETSLSETMSNPSLGLWESSSVSVPVVASGRNSISAPRSSFYRAHKDDSTSMMVPRCVSPDKLDSIWRSCVERCDPERLRHLLYAHGKLVSITETKGILIAYIAFGDSNKKSRAERFLGSITNSIAIVLKHNVEVRIGLVPEKYLKSLKPLQDSSSSKHTEILEYLDKARKLEPNVSYGSSDIPRSVDKLQGSQEMIDIPVLRDRKTSIDELRLENAWLQAAENSEDPLVSHSNEPKQEKNENSSEVGTDSQNQFKSLPDLSSSLKHWRGRESDEISEVETDGSQSSKQHVGNVGRRTELYHHPISPSLLHKNSFRAKAEQESLGHDSGSNRSGICCWKILKSNTGKVKQGNQVRSQRSGGCFGHC